MVKYVRPTIIGIIVTVVLGLLPFISFSPIIGGLIAGIICKSGPSVGAEAGFRVGFISAILFLIIVAWIKISDPSAVEMTGRLAAGSMVVLTILGLAGGWIGGLIGRKE